MPQSLAKVYLHAVFSTKSREPLIDNEWRDEFHSLIGGSVNNLNCQSLAVGGTADHVHLLFQLARTVSIADAIGRVKSVSSAWANQRHGQTKRFEWQAGYGVFSVSQSNLDMVREYVLTQERHHQVNSFEDEFRKLLAKHGITWDERYVWD